VVELLGGQWHLQDTRDQTPYLTLWCLIKRKNILSVGGNSSIDSKAFASISRPVGSVSQTQSLGGVYGVCVCVHKDKCMYVYVSVCVCTGFRKKRDNIALMKGHRCRLEGVNRQYKILRMYRTKVELN
jgi:hypothetical protein